MASKSETSIYNGIKFYRYPKSEKWSDRVYFRCAPKLHEKGIYYLHHEIWKSSHGEIPEGHVIHHKDGNPTNNDIENLECMEFAEHMSMHSKQYFANPENREKCLEHLDNIRPLTVEWHGSPEGIEWHRQHAIDGWKSRAPIKKICVVCGKEFDDITLRENARFCSNKCKSAYRRQSGVDDEERKCVVCGAVFVANKYSKRKTCSKKCTSRLRAKNAREKKRLQSDSR